MGDQGGSEDHEAGSQLEPAARARARADVCRGLRQDGLEKVERRM